MAAIQVGVGGDPVADGKAADADTDLDDFGRDLVPDDAWKLDGHASGLDVLNGQPGPAGEHAGDGFPRTGNGIGNLAHLEWRVRSLQNHCFHDVVLQDHSRNMKLAAFRKSVRLTPSECR